MFKRGYRKYGKRRTTGKKRSYSRRRGVKSQVVTKPMLYRAIRRNVETKQATNTYTFTEFNSTIGNTGDIIVVLPAITAGTAQNQRVGSKIKPLRLEIIGYCCCLSTLTNGSNYTKDAKLLGVRLLVYENRANKSVYNSTPSYNLLDYGGNSTTFSTGPQDFQAPLNKELFKFYADKKWVMMKPNGFTEIVNGGGGAPTVTDTIISMDKSMYRPFKIVLKAKDLPSVLNYDNGLNANYPLNFNPLISLGYVHLLLSTMDVVSPLIGMQFIATLYYEDA